MGIAELIDKYFVVQWSIIISLCILLYLYICKKPDGLRYKLFYFIERHTKVVLLTGFFLTLSIGIFIYYCVYGLTAWQAVYYGVLQFMFDTKTPPEFGLEIDFMNHSYQWIYIPAIMAAMISTLTIMILFFKEYIYTQHATYIANKGGHIVLCGIGENNRYFIDNLVNCEDRRKIPNIIVLESNKENPLLKKYEKKENIAIIIGDAKSKENLDRVGLRNCKYVIISTGNDIVNLSILSQIRIKEKEKSNEKRIYSKIYVHVSRRESEIYFDEEKLLEKDAASATHFYNYNELSARRLFSELLLVEGLNTVNNDDVVHLMIIGFGDMGQEVALQAAMQGHFYNKKRIRITVVDNNENTFESFRAIHWNIDKVCYFQTKLCSINSQKFYEWYFRQNNKPTYVVFALGNDKVTFSSLSILIHRLKQKNRLVNMPIPNIAVRFKQNVNDKIKESYEDMLEPLKFKIFGQSSLISTEKFVTEHEIDIYAKKINEDYRRANGYWKVSKNKSLHCNICRCEININKTIQAVRDTLENGNLTKPVWNELNNFTKDSNRATADHFNNIKKDVLKRLNIPILDKNKFYNPSDEIIEKYYDLIDMEHRRWNAFHFLNGWEHRIFTKEEGINKEPNLKLHGCLIDTNRLKEFAISLDKSPYEYYQYDLETYIREDEDEDEEGIR